MSPKIIILKFSCLTISKIDETYTAGKHDKCWEKYKKKKETHNCH